MRGISDESYGELTLPLEGKTDHGNMRVTIVDTNAFEGNQSIVSLTVPEGYRRIEQGAFKDCINLETVKLPSTLEYIAPDAFEGCTKLKYETVDGLVYLDSWLVDKSGSYAESYTVREGTYYIKAGVFAGTYNKNNTVTKNITLPSSLLIIENEAFAYCSELEEIVIPGSVKVIPESAFYECRSLKRVEICEGVEEIQKKAFDCIFESQIEEISIPSTVKNIQTGAVPKMETVDGFGYADGWLVSYNGSVTYGVTPRDGTVGIAGGVFTYEVTSVNVVDSVKYISDEAFKGNRYLLAVTGLEGVEYVGDKAFYECISLATIEFGSKLKEIGENAFAQCEDLKTVRLGNSLEVISERAFAYCESLNFSGFSLPDSVKWIGAYAFDGSSGVVVKQNGCAYVGNWLVQSGMKGGTEIPDNSLISGVTGGAVSNDGGLVIRDGTVGIAAGVFHGNRVLKSVTIPGSVKYICEEAFGMNNYDIICEKKTGWVAYSRKYDDIKINLDSQQVSNISSFLFFVYSNLVFVNETN